VNGSRSNQSDSLLRHAILRNVSSGSTVPQQRLHQKAQTSNDTSSGQDIDGVESGVLDFGLLDDDVDTGRLEDGEEGADGRADEVGNADAKEGDDSEDEDTDGENEIDPWMQELNAAEELAKSSRKPKGLSTYEIERNATIARNKAAMDKLAAEWKEMSDEFREDVNKKKRARAPRGKKKPTASKSTASNRRSTRSTIAPPPSTPVTPSDLPAAASTSSNAPEWLTEAVSSLKALDGVAGWQDLVDGFYLLDAQLGFPQGKVRTYTISTVSFVF
jgi:DNA polymerase III gamma/tau subunit